jgi:acyl-CoA synthetase (AMP-forming)/AMP-acid ligase II
MMDHQTTSEAGMWGTEVTRAGWPVPFLVYRQRRRRVTELLDDTARWADRDHLVQGRRRITFKAMIEAANRVAAHLSARGLGPGQRMLLLAGNSPEWVISLWAGLRLGAVVAPGNRWWSTDEIAHATRLIAPSVIVADPRAAKALPAGTQIPVVPVGDIRGWAEAPEPWPVPTLNGRDLSAVRSISLGGAPVTPELAARLRAAFPSVRRGVSTVYGMTEAGGTVAAGSGALMAEHPGTAGRPMPVVELRIEKPDDTGAGEALRDAWLSEEDPWRSRGLV